jgi:hypothetical protein
VKASREIKVRDQVQVYALALCLRKHFDAAVKSRFKTPNVAACFTVAQILATIEICEWKHPRPAESSRILAVKRLRLALGALAAVKQDFERCAEAELGGDFHAVACEIDVVTAQAEALIPMLLGDPRDPIIVIKEAAQVAWEHKNGAGNCPRSHRADAPLAKFIAAALGEIGMERSVWAVKSVLSKERRRYAK